MHIRELEEYLLRVLTRLDRVERQVRKIPQMEIRMSAFDDQLAALDQATTDIANRIDQLVKDEGDLDASFAAKLQPELDKLRSLGTPVSTPPADGGDGSVPPAS